MVEAQKAFLRKVRGDMVEVTKDGTFLLGDISYRVHLGTFRTCVDRGYLIPHATLPNTYVLNPKYVRWLDEQMIT